MFHKLYIILLIYSDPYPYISTPNQCPQTLKTQASTSIQTHFPEMQKLHWNNKNTKSKPQPQPFIYQQLNTLQQTQNLKFPISGKRGGKVPNMKVNVWTKINSCPSYKPLHFINKQPKKFQLFYYLALNFLSYQTRPWLKP